jgi:hypothetical protein
MKGFRTVLGKAGKLLVMCVFGLLGMAVGAVLVIAVGFTLYDLAPQLFKDEMEVLVYVAVGLVFCVFCGLIYGARAGAFVWEWLRHLADD